jgi:hypothetical protein
MLTQTEWEAKGRALFGEDKSRWAFKCPICGNAMSIERARAEFPELKGSGWAPEQECAGRYTDRVKRKDGKRRDWCAYGLFRGPLVVRANSGNEVPVFEFAEPVPAPPEDPPAP